MRLWTIHPKYLDSKGLVALWREGLLAKAVLEGKTKGYKNHPQLNRFYEQDDPVAYIVEYLRSVLSESVDRGYRFNSLKIPSEIQHLSPIEETSGQLNYEWNHLMNKLRDRDPIRHDDYSELLSCGHHPMFRLVNGDVRSWEKLDGKMLL